MWKFSTFHPQVLKMGTQYSLQLPVKIHTKNRLLCFGIYTLDSLSYLEMSQKMVNLVGTLKLENPGIDPGTSHMLNERSIPLEIIHR